MFILYTAFHIKPSTASCEWFEERHQQLETLESQFRRLQASLEGLYSHRRELAFATAALGKGLALLSNGEDHAGLSRALAKMAELHDKVNLPFNSGSLDPSL